MSAENSEHWQGRVKCEEILEVGCPKCGAKPHAWCDRAGEKLSKQGQQLTKAGTPPSHQERMWVRQGHAEHELPGLRAKQRTGWDEDKPAAGRRAARSGPRGGCTPCASERKVREALNSPLFPVDFPCRHPGSGRVPQFPVCYTGDRPCPECGGTRLAEVVVRDALTIGYRCGARHMWLSGPVRPRPVASRTVPPKPVLIGKTGSPVGDDGEDRPPWEAETP